MNLGDIRTIYFVGIGGIGMSAIARFFNARGVAVHGYDKTETTLTKTLVSEGIKIHFEEDVSQIPENVDLVVYTPAVPQDHKELVHFRENGFPVKKRAEVLGIISHSKKTIAVAGTHGKTSTSSILIHLLRVGGLDATAFLGGIATNYQSNFISGDGDWVVVEADEYDRSFLHLSPDVAVILSMEADHLDIYGDEESIVNTGFLAFAKKLKKGGNLWVQNSLVSHFENLAVKGFALEEGGYRAENIRVEAGQFVFDYVNPEVEIRGLKFGLPGRHNIENATAAICVALQLGVQPKAIRKALTSFKGIRRRFELIWKGAEAVYYNDYAHHPSELRAAISAARELYPAKKILGIFQPHLFSRTRDFAEGFANALDQLDELLLMDIYPARELPIEGVNSKMVFDLMQLNKKQLVGSQNLIELLEGKTFDVLLTLGAGDINFLVEPIKRFLSERGTMPFS